MVDNLVPVATLLDRYAPDRASAVPPVASLSWRGRQRRDVRRLLGYLVSFGEAPKSPDELVAAVASLPEEDEIGAHRVLEGVAVSHASSGG